MTLEMSQMTIFDVSGESEDQYRLSLSDFLVKLFPLLENVKDLQTKLEVLSFLKSSGSHLFSDPSFYSLRTWMDSETTTEEERSESSSVRWMRWGTWGGGRCLTARISEFPKTENASSLSQVLETDVPEKYFLSSDKTMQLLKSLDGSKETTTKIAECTELGGVAPTLSTMQGGGQEPKILDDQGRTNKKNRLSDIAPTLRAQSHGNEPKVVVTGQLDSDRGGTGKVYDPEGIAPTQLAQHGNAVTKIIDSKPTQFSVDGEGIAYCLDTGYAKNLSPNEVGKGKRTQVVITVGNVNPSGNGMNGNVFDAEGLSPTLTTNKGEGVKVLQRQFAGQYGLTEDVTGTLQASRVDKVPMVVEEPRAISDPERLNKVQNGRRMKEPGDPMFTLTAMERHGVAVLRSVRTEYGKEVRKQYETGMIDESRHNMMQLEPRDDGIANTLTTVQKDNLLYNGYRIRKLTPLECFRLQSWPDEWYVKLKLFRKQELIELIDMSRNDITAQVLALIEKHGIKEGISDSQLYKMAGNGVTSKVSYEIGWRLREIYESEVIA